MSLTKRRHSKPGSSPGSLAPARQRAERVNIHIIRYDSQGLEERETATIEEALACLDKPGITWIDLIGLHELGPLQQLAARLDIHPLVLEDIFNTDQRPKMEDYTSYLFVVMKYFHQSQDHLSEQVSLLIGNNYVISVQEIPGDAFEPVRQRARLPTSRIRNREADYLGYALIDSLVDHLFPVAESLGEEIEELEDIILEKTDPRIAEKIQVVKKKLLLLRRAVWPQREILSSMERLDESILKKSTRVFLRDCYDHTVQIMDMIETYRDLGATLMELHLSRVSHRMNEVMKVLTVMASIFIPLTFLAGIYGMNFNTEISPFNMPELNWYWGYPAFWLTILVLSGVMLFLFKRKGWL